MLNAARLKVLKAREDHVGVVLEEAKKLLGEITKDEVKYQNLLQSLIAQGLLQVRQISNSFLFALKYNFILQLLELNVLLRCRQADLKMVESVMATAVATYKQKTGKECNLKVDESFLNPNV
jgi:V-type H+-transporting ATPase subunit E